MEMEEDSQQTPQNFRARVRLGAHGPKARQAKGKARLNSYRQVA